MNNQNLPSCEDFTSYILGELTEAEVAAFLEHVKGCKQCQMDLEDILPLSETLLQAEEDDDIILSDTLKQRTLEAAFAKRAPNTSAPLHAPRFPQRKRKLRIFQTASTIAAALMLGVVLGRLTVAPSTPVKNDAPATMMNEVTLTSASADSTSKGMAMVYKRGPDLNLVVYVKNMQPLDNWGCYSLWVTNGNGRQNIGDFTVDQHGDAVLSVHLSNPRAVDTLLITREPAWNDPSPQGPAVLRT